MPSRLTRAALSATSGERNTAVRRTNDSRTTAPMKTASRSAKRLEMSMNAAVVPVTSMTVRVSASRVGTVSPRRRSTRSSVAGSWGLVVGMAWMTAVSPVSLVWAGDASCTPGVAATAVLMVAERAGGIGDLHAGRRRSAGAR
jgi:hypothetical protein